MYFYKGELSDILHTLEEIFKYCDLEYYTPGKKKCPEWVSSKKMNNPDLAVKMKSWRAIKEDCEYFGYFVEKRSCEKLDYSFLDSIKWSHTILYKIDKDIKCERHDLIFEKNQSLECALI